MLTTRSNVPYNTGKVLIGLRYTPPLPTIQGDAIKVQSALLSPRATPARGITNIMNYLRRYL